MNTGTQEYMMHVKGYRKKACCCFLIVYERKKDGEILEIESWYI